LMLSVLSKGLNWTVSSVAVLHGWCTINHWHYLLNAIAFAWQLISLRFAPDATFLIIRRIAWSSFSRVVTAVCARTIFVTTVRKSGFHIRCAVSRSRVTMSFTSRTLGLVNDVC
jgi:hypothetical protein